MKNKKGFTFIEILAVIIVISLVAVLAIPQIQKISVNSKIKLCKNKLTLIEENVNLWASNNKECFIDGAGSCLISFIEKDFSNSIFITSLSNMASSGIIDSEDLDSIMIQDKKSDELYIKIDAKNIEKVESKVGIYKDYSFVNDNNFNEICGNSKINTEVDEDSSNWFTKKVYNVYICKDNICGSSPSKTVEIYDNKRNTTCLEYSIPNYQYIGYETNDNILKCNFTSDKYQLNIAHNNIDIIGIADSSMHKLGEEISFVYTVKEGYELTGITCEPNVCKINGNSITINMPSQNVNITMNTKKSIEKYQLNIVHNNIDIVGIADSSMHISGEEISFVYTVKEGYELTGITCEPNVCKINGNSITINMPSQNVNITLNTKKSNITINIYKYLENANDNGYSYSSNTTKTMQNSPTNSEKINICKEGIPANSYYSSNSFSNNTLKCYYKRNTYKITSISFNYTVKQTNFNPTGGTYKVGQKITMTYEFIDGYTKDSVVCSVSSACSDDGPNQTIITMPSSNLEIEINSKERNDYYLHAYVENTNDENFVESSTYSKYIIITDTSTTGLNNACTNNAPTGFEYNTRMGQKFSSIDTTKKSLICYYNRKTYTLTYDFTDTTDKTGTFANKYNSRFYTPDSAYKFGYVKKDRNYSTLTSTYKYGQTIILSNILNSGYELASVNCSVSNQCKQVGDLTIITMPASNMTVKPVVQEKKETVNVKVYLENADDENFTEDTSKAYTQSGVVFKDSEEDMLNTVCGAKTYTGFEFDNTRGTKIGYIDNTTANRTVYCYYNRKTYTLTYDFTDTTDKTGTFANKYNSRFYTPDSAYKFGYVKKDRNYSTLTSTYKYGQTIILSNILNSGYELASVNCSVSNQCKQVGDLTIITMPASNMTVKPVVQEKKETVNVKVYLENADDENFTEDTSKAYTQSGVVFKDSEEDMLNTVCGAKTYTGFEFDNTRGTKIGYIDNTTANRTVYCYYNRKTYTLTYNFSDSNITKKIYFPKSDYLLASGTSTSTTKVSKSYKYGQNIKLVLSTFKTGYSLSNVKCMEGTVASNACYVVGNVVNITMPASPLTVKPIAGTS